MYTISNGCLIRDADGAFIPQDAKNRDYVKYVLWVDAGNSPTVASTSVNDVVIERTRRLTLGFDYDFGDARGVHHIGTSSADMEGWRDVIDYANALVDLGDTLTQIAIVTNTGPALVTAPEWQAVMLEAAEVRQLIWARSFALQAMNPIPSDYADDSYWT